MIVTWTQLLILLATWGINKAAPAVFHHASDPATIQRHQAEYLCKKEHKCEAMEVQALQGMKPVVRLETEAVPVEPKELTK